MYDYSAFTNLNNGYDATHQGEWTNPWSDQNKWDEWIFGPRGTDRGIRRQDPTTGITSSIDPYTLSDEEKKILFPEWAKKPSANAAPDYGITSPLYSPNDFLKYIFAKSPSLNPVNQPQWNDPSNSWSYPKYYQERNNIQPSILNQASSVSSPSSTPSTPNILNQSLATVTNPSNSYSSPAAQNILNTSLSQVAQPSYGQNLMASTPTSPATTGGTLNFTPNDPSAVAGYFRNNPDVAAEYSKNTYGLTPEQFAQTHYDKYGKSEGRINPYEGQLSTTYQEPDVFGIAREATQNYFKKINGG